MRINKNIIPLLAKSNTISRLARISLWLYGTNKETSDRSLDRGFPGVEKLKPGPACESGKKEKGGKEDEKIILINFYPFHLDVSMDLYYINTL